MKINPILEKIVGDLNFPSCPRCKILLSKNKFSHNFYCEKCYFLLMYLHTDVMTTFLHKGIGFCLSFKDLKDNQIKLTSQDGDKFIVDICPDINKFKIWKIIEDKVNMILAFQ